ncbi:MAG: M48 family metallopeptidase [Bdellovibrionales bacterium]|nr:M48 family metallopeptidase [Bdellovibrionales bacterium]
MKVGKYLVHRRVKKNSRNVSLRVEANGNVVVHASKSRSAREIRDFVEEKSDWIESCLKNAKLLAENFPPFFWEAGKRIPLLGDFFEIKNRIGISKQVRVEEKALVIESPKGWVSQETFRKRFSKFYKEAAENYLNQAVQYWSKQMDLYPRSIKIKSAKGYWGTCSPNRQVTFNFKLIAAPPEVIDYVVIHELAHLKHLNHSKDFWELVSRHHQRHRLCRRWLRENQFAFEFFDEGSTLHSSRLLKRDALL